MRTTARAWIAGAASWALAVASSATALAASPTPGPGGDPRSSGQGPGLVGDPAFALIAVAAIGLGTLVVTLLYIRLTGGRRT
jgi:hypothetical protein